MRVRSVLGVLLGAILALVATPLPASAVTTIQMSATITNTDGVGQNGTVCLELVGSGSCGGTFFTAGSWSYAWNDEDYEPGDYLIRVVSSTMNGTSRWYVAGNTAGTTDKALATPVHLAAGEPDFSFTMVMPAIAKVTGRVVDTGGAGVSGLPVLLNQSGVIRQTVTNGTGGYDLGYTRAGSWKLTVNGGSTYGTEHAALVVPASGAVVVDDIVVQLAASISGEVTDSVTGDPLPFVDVLALSAADPSILLGGASTDAAGHYEIGGLGSEPLVLQFTDWAHNGYLPTLNDGGDPSDYSPKTPITLAEAEDRVYDEALDPKSPAPPPPHNLAGTVTDADDRPLAGIIVTFGDLTDVTDRLGHWYLDAPDGTHPLDFAQDSPWTAAWAGQPGWSPESYPGSLVSETATPVTVSGGVGAVDLDVTLVRVVSNTVAPVISGTAEAGQVLTASTGTWVAPTGTTYTTTWLRDGAPVGTGASYVVGAADAGSTLRARVTGTFGAAVRHALSAPRAVGRLATTTTASGKSRKPHKVKIKVLVTASGVTPTGTVTVLRGSKVVKSGVPLVGGRARVVLRGQPSGRRSYTVTFDGATQTQPSTSPRFRVKVL